MRAAFFISVHLIACSSSLLTADDELVLKNPSHQSGDFVVLQNGRVVRGHLTPRPGGYDIAMRSGRMFVASEQVRFRASNMDEAWRRMRESVQELTPETHMNLARWCLTNKMPGRARQEVLDALHLDPYHSEAKQLLQALVRYEKRLNERKAPEKIDLSMPAPERRSLGGLPVRLARDFTRYVQPIVCNKCGNASCHGSGKNDFEVVSLRNGLNAWTSEQNLAAILKQIDVSNPSTSPLLAATQGGHGNSRELLFAGQTGRQQLEKLRDWVADAAVEMGGAATSTTSNTATSDSVAASISAAIDPEHPAANETLDATVDLDQRLIRDAIQETRVDRFSPATFNEKYHGIQATSATTSGTQLTNLTQSTQTILR